MEIKTIRGTYDSNTFAVINGGEAVIIDAGAPLKDVADALNGAKVLGVFLTHEHFDHIRYAPDYARAWGCGIYGLRECYDNYVYYKTLVTVDGRKYKMPPLGDVKFNWLQDESAVTLGAFTLKPYHAPGHAWGSLVYQIGDDIFTGDVLFSRGIGRIDTMSYGKKHMTETLERLKGLEFETAHHGHGADSTHAAQQKNISVWLKWLGR